MGVHDQLMYSITKSDMDLRRTLWANIMLSGGNTMIKGFGDRLLHEIKKLNVKDVKIKVFFFSCFFLLFLFLPLSSPKEEKK